MIRPFGPKAIAKNRQVAIPKELLDQIGLGVGDLVYVALDDRLDGALLVLPEELVTTWIEKGRNRTGRKAPSGRKSDPR